MRKSFLAFAVTVLTAFIFIGTSQYTNRIDSNQIYTNDVYIYGRSSQSERELTIPEYTVAGSLLEDGGWLLPDGGPSAPPDDAGHIENTYAFSPNRSVYRVTCADTQGCILTLSESGVMDGQLLTVVNWGTPTVVIPDTSGVSETASGGVTLGQYDSATFRYVYDRWVEMGASNN